MIINDFTVQRQRQRCVHTALCTYHVRDFLKLEQPESYRSLVEPHSRTSFVKINRLSLAHPFSAQTLKISSSHDSHCGPARISSG